MDNVMPFHVALIAALIKIVLAVGAIMITVPMLVWLERKLLADIQARIGPNRVGPFGLLQSFADGIKLLCKEALTPGHVDRLFYFAAPIVVMIPALSVAAVIPFMGDLRVGDYVHKGVIADLPIGVLLVLAITSLGVYGIVLSGWSSENKYSLLGGLRSSAQMVSYELPMGLSVIAGLLIASAGSGNIFSLSLSRVVELQEGWIWNWVAFNWKFAFLGLVAAITFYICGLAETNRTPFDLPEAETELVGGYHTEYGGMKFAMFFLAEYAAMLNIAAVTTTLFLGGWHGPYPSPFERGSIPYALESLTWFLVKVFAIIVVYIWIRGTLPRLRYDQLMGFAWKRLMPFTLALVFVIGAMVTAFHGEEPPAVLTQAVAPQIQAQPNPALGAPTGGVDAPAPDAGHSEDDGHGHGAVEPSETPETAAPAAPAAPAAENQTTPAAGEPGTTGGQ